MVGRSIGSGSLHLSSNGSNPDGRESHSLNIVQLKYHQYYPEYPGSKVIPFSQCLSRYRRNISDNPLVPE